MTESESVALPFGDSPLFHNKMNYKVYLKKIKSFFNFFQKIFPGPDTKIFSGFKPCPSVGSTVPEGSGKFLSCRCSFGTVKIKLFYTLKPLCQLCVFFFISWFSQKREHVALITLHPGLVKRIHSQYIAADTAGKLKEIE